MAVRKTGRSQKLAASGHPGTRSTARRYSALVGGVLICLALIWFAWLVAHQFNGGSVAIHFPFAGQPRPTAQSTVEPLVAAGITLATPPRNQEPSLGQQQAQVLADQLVPQAAAHAGSTSATYVLFSYKKSQAVPAWLVHYSRVGGPGPDTGADPHASSVPHDCYVFLDATTGQELLALWT